VSTFLHDELTVGDKVEVRGPIGRLVRLGRNHARASPWRRFGIVPLMAMLRLARRTPHQTLAHLVVSVRTPGDLIYANQLEADDATVIYTRQAPADATRAVGRLTLEDLAPYLRPDAVNYICGSSAFADAASEHLVNAGVDTNTIRVERFGPTG